MCYCRHWGKLEEGVFKFIGERALTARRCSINPKLATFLNDVCNDWHRS
jgi:hypothetical protein